MSDGIPVCGGGGRRGVRAGWCGVLVDSLEGPAVQQGSTDVPSVHVADLAPWPGVLDGRDVLPRDIEVLFGHHKIGEGTVQRGGVVAEVCGEVQDCPEGLHSVPVQLAPLPGLLAVAPPAVVALMHSGALGKVGR